MNRYLDLLESYALSLLDSPSPLFDHYVGKNMYAYWDDINGYVDYADVLDAYALALLTGKSFDLDDYTAGAQARPAEISRVQVVSLEQGQLKFREKVLADPLDQALAEVNGAGDAPGLRAILEARAQILGLSLQDTPSSLKAARTPWPRASWPRGAAATRMRLRWRQSSPRRWKGPWRTSATSWRR